MLRSVAIASWTDNRLKGNDTAPHHYIAIVETEDQVRVFCENTIRIARTCVSGEPGPIVPGHFQVTVRVKETGQEMTTHVPIDPKAMYGSVAIASLMTAGTVNTTYKNQHVQDAGVVNVPDF